jgi:hypothetical protein
MNYKFCASKNTTKTKACQKKADFKPYNTQKIDSAQF